MAELRLAHQRGQALAVFQCLARGHPPDGWDTSAHSAWRRLYHSALENTDRALDLSFRRRVSTVAGQLWRAGLDSGTSTNCGRRRRREFASWVDELAGLGEQRCFDLPRPWSGGSAHADHGAPQGHPNQRRRLRQHLLRAIWREPGWVKPLPKIATP